MTNDQLKSLKDDIAYMKALADEGSQGPLLGGSILVMAGLVFGLASVVEWAMASDLLSDGGGIGHLWNWGLSGLVFAIGLIVLIRRGKGRPGELSPSNRAFANAWMGVGIAIFSMAVSLSVMSFQLQSPLPAMVFPSLIFALYGSGWAISAAMSGQKWLWGPAFGGWALAPVVAWFTGDPVQYLVYAAGLILLALVPGVILMRGEPSEVI